MAADHSCAGPVVFRAVLFPAWGILPRTPPARLTAPREVDLLTRGMIQAAKMKYKEQLIENLNSGRGMTAAIVIRAIVDQVGKDGTTQPSPRKLNTQNDTSCKEQPVITS